MARPVSRPPAACRVTPKCPRVCVCVCVCGTRLTGTLFCRCAQSMAITNGRFEVRKAGLGGCRWHAPAHRQGNPGTAPTAAGEPAKSLRIQYGTQWAGNKGLVPQNGPPDWRVGQTALPDSSAHAPPRCGFKLANDGVDTRALQHFLGHRNIMHTVRYTELRSDRFDGFWKD